MANNEKDFEKYAFEAVGDYLKELLTFTGDLAAKGLKDFDATYFKNEAQKLFNHIETLNNDIARQANIYSSQDKFPAYLNNQIKNTLDRIKYCEINADRFIEKADSAIKNSKYIKGGLGVAGIALTANELYQAYQESQETGDYNLVNEVAVKALGATLGTALASHILIGIGVSVASSIGTVVIAAVAITAAAYVGEKAGEWVWQNVLKPYIFEPVQNWLTDKFEDWFGLNRSGKFHIYDPLVLDLDGDGIELLKADGWNGVQFDYNGDGIKSSTGWVKADDGLLVWDRNGDGIINNGSEIFGEDMFPQKINHTITNTSSSSGSNSSGSGMTVSGGPSNATPIIENDGFYALSQLDSNQDWVIDCNDQNFNQIKVWRDLNQDGISEVGELFTLNELDIQSINLNTGNTKNNTAGNSIGKSSTYTKTDGSNGKIADINFTLDTVHSEYIEHITIGEEQMLLPYLHGVGKLRDLREAATLSPELTDLLQQYQLATQKEEQTALLDNLMLYWARTNSSFKENGILFDVGNMVATAEGGSTGVTASQAAGGGVVVEDFCSGFR